MLFNSFEFLFIFLPVVWIGYVLLNHYRLLVASKTWLIAASLLFYGWWNPIYVPLMLGSILVNYRLGIFLDRIHDDTRRKFILVAGLVFNIGLLAYFKYADFFLSNMNQVFRTDFPLPHIVLPLAISFFTFQQIAFVVDSYRRVGIEREFMNYLLFITFFPHLIAGPITHHQEMMPQFANLRQKLMNYRHIALGIFMFSIGLFKKVIIADSFAEWVSAGYAHTAALSFIEGWIVSLSYTFQLYFDFSGYTDMAIGIALLFNIRLPINFNSPYKSLSITEFWQRWHMTLTRFMTKYVYIPLGGNRLGMKRMYVNIFLVFLISGFWHGASWTFVLWGVLHGLATLIHRYWQSFQFNMNRILAWIITFNFLNITWVFFRAETWLDAKHILLAMFGFQGMAWPNYDVLMNRLPFLSKWGISFEHYFITNDALLLCVIYTIISFAIVLWMKNTRQLAEKFQPTWYWLIVILAMNVYSVTHFTRVSEFLYFNF